MDLVQGPGPGLTSVSRRKVLDKGSRGGFCSKAVDCRINGKETMTDTKPSLLAKSIESGTPMAAPVLGWAAAGLPFCRCPFQPLKLSRATAAYSEGYTRSPS